MKILTSTNTTTTMALGVLLCLLACTSRTLAFQVEQSYFGGSDNEPYLEWANRRGETSFDHSYFLEAAASPGDGTAFHWSIHNGTTTEAGSIRIAVAARAQGWVGFGLSENGGMRGADMVLFRADQPNQVTDAYVMESLYPIKDSCQSWEILYSQTHDGFLIFEAQRALDTGDSQDRKIVPDTGLIQPTRIISAWGDSAGWSYHGPNFGKGAVRLFGDGMDEYESFLLEMETEAEGSFFIGADDFLIPAVETTYAEFCFNETFLRDQGVPLDKELHIIGIDPFVDNRTTKFVHHFTFSSTNSVSYDANGNCIADLGPALYIWAPGVLPLRYPSFLGLPFENFSALRLSTHYNNPGFETDKLDSSGIRVYWTSKKRPVEVGTLSLADYATLLEGTSVGNGGLSKHSFSCPSSCTQMTLSGLSEPITVFSANFHMHLTGQRADVNVIRNGEVIRTSSIDFFDYDQTGDSIPQEEPYQLLPGDAFDASFYYNAPDPNQVFGFASQDEMAILGLKYYPRQTMLNGRVPLMCSYGIPIPNCRVDYKSEALTDDSDLGRTFGTPVTDTANVPTCIVASPTNGETVHYDPTTTDSEEEDDNDADTDNTSNGDNMDTSAGESLYRGPYWRLSLTVTVVVIGILAACDGRSPCDILGGRDELVLPSCVRAYSSCREHIRICSMVPIGIC